jgi:hypothetical protein
VAARGERLRPGGQVLVAAARHLQVTRLNHLTQPRRGLEELAHMRRLLE